jgi:hypothetical protein
MCSDPLTLRLGAVLVPLLWSSLICSYLLCLLSALDLVWSGLLSSRVWRTRRHLLEGFRFPC